jgi:hypothetical protein
MPIPNDPLYKTGKQKLQAKDYVGALADFNQLIASNPGHFAHAARASARGSLGDVKGAIEDLGVAFSMSNDPAYQLRRGMLRLRLWDLLGGLQDTYSGISSLRRQK